jgi:hypothetical protein
MKAFAESWPVCCNADTSESLVSKRIARKLPFPA